MIKDDTQDCFAAVHEKDQNRKMSNFSQYAAANNDPSKNILSPVYLSSKFNPTSARAGIAVPSIVMFKCNVGGLSELCHICCGA